MSRDLLNYFMGKEKNLVNIQTGERLKEFAKQFGGIADLERKLGKGRNFFSSYTSGTSALGSEILRELSKMGCDINWLLTGIKSTMIKENSPQYGENINKRLEKLEHRMEEYDLEISLLRKKNERHEAEKKELLESIESLYNGIDKSMPVALALEKLLNSYKTG